MKRLGILHITDLHHDLAPTETVGEVKDKAISPWLADDLTYKDPFSLFLNQIKNVLGKKPVHVLAFSGDIGWGKHPDTLVMGIERLKALGDRLDLKPTNVLIAPGNHDLVRTGSPGQELEDFIAACRREGFTCAERLKPAIIPIEDIPIIILNTCLGGTEHALHGLPGSFWDDVRIALKQLLTGATNEELLDAMDIPAIGNTQLDAVGDQLNQQIGNCAVIIGHHPPLPTYNSEVRPLCDAC